MAWTMELAVFGWAAKSPALASLAPNNFLKDIDLYKTGGDLYQTVAKHIGRLTGGYSLRDILTRGDFLKAKDPEKPVVPPQDAANALWEFKRLQAESGISPPLLTHALLSTIPEIVRLNEMPPPNEHPLFLQCNQIAHLLESRKPDPKVDMMD